MFPKIFIWSESHAAKTLRSPLCSQNDLFLVKNDFDKNKVEKSRMEKTQVEKNQNSVIACCGNLQKNENLEQSLSVEIVKKGFKIPLGFLEHPFCCKISKN